jgi:hypothetical protein
VCCSAILEAECKTGLLPLRPQIADPLLLLPGHGCGGEKELPRAYLKLKLPPGGLQATATSNIAKELALHILRLGPAMPVVYKARARLRAVLQDCFSFSPQPHT